MKREGKRSKKEKRGGDDGDDAPYDSDEDPKKVKARAALPWYSKLNYSAIIILLMMVLPTLLVGGMSLYDKLYPEEAKARALRDRVVKCYSSADPSKLPQIDSFLRKYRGKEHILFHSLKDKYGKKHPSCDY